MYWSILTSSGNEKKIPLIPPILVNNQHVTHLLKANLFNDLFLDNNVILFIMTGFSLVVYLKTKSNISSLDICYFIFCAVSPIATIKIMIRFYACEHSIYLLWSKWFSQIKINNILLSTWTLNLINSRCSC